MGNMLNRGLSFCQHRGRPTPKLAMEELREASLGPCSISQNAGGEGLKKHVACCSFFPSYGY